MPLFETSPLNVPYLERAVERFPAIVTPDSSLINVITLMTGVGSSCALPSSHQTSNFSQSGETHSNYVLVMEGAQLVGLFTQKDVVRLTVSKIKFAGVKIAEVMTQPVITFPQSKFQGIFTVLSLFHKHQIRHLPLLDNQKKLAGVVTSQSICQVLPTVNFLKSRTVAEVINSQVICASATTSMLSLACLMAENNASCVVIVDPDTNNQRQPVGIVTERDLIQLQALTLDLSQILAQTVMNTPLFWSRLDNSVWAAYQEMQQQHVQQLVVCGSQGELQGIITENSILQANEPAQTYKALKQLQSSVQRLEAEKMELLQNRNAELERFVEERTAQLQEQAECDRLLATIAHRIRQSLNLEEILNNTVSEIRQFLKTDRVIIYRLNSDSGGIAIVESVDSCWTPMLGITITDSYFEQHYVPLYQQGRIQALSDIYTADLTPCHMELLTQFQVRANLVVPIVQNEQTIPNPDSSIATSNRLWGLLVAQNCGEPRQWRQSEIDLIKRLSTQVAIAIQQAELYQQAQTDLIERQRVEEEIRQLNVKLEQRVQERTQKLLATNTKLEAEISHRHQTEERLTKINGCFLSFGSEPHENINRLTALCGELLNATSAIYNRLDGELLYALGRWNTPTDFKLANKLDEQICYDVIQYSQGIKVVENLPSSHYAQINANINRYQWQTYVGHPVKCSKINIGSLCLLYKHDFVPSDADKKLLSIIASAIGVEEERQLAAEKIQTTQTFLDSIVENIPNMIFVKDVQEFRYVRFNKAGESLVGYSRTELIGKNDYELFPPEEANFFITKDREVLESKEMVDILEAPIQTKYHGIRILHTKKIPILDQEGKPHYILGISEDITEQKQAEEALLQSQAHFRNLVEQTNDLVWEVDKYFVFTYVNPQMQKLLGYEPTEVLGKALFDFMSEDEAQRFTTILDFLTPKQEPFTHLEKTLIHQDGHSIVFETSGLPLFNAQGELQGYRGIARDITKRKQVEQEMRKALAKEKELNELKSSFITIASHEFRTPLTTILGSAESLEYYHQKWSDEKKISYLQRIQKSVKHMVQMLNDVLILGKAEEEKIEFNPEQLDLESFCREIVEDLQLNNSKNNSIHFDFVNKLTDIPPYLDEKLLRHILSNLLSNAIKYSLPDSSIDFSVFFKNGAVVFQIKDRGIGIPIEDQLRLFEPFHRAKNVSNIPGTGLGLAIVKKSVELHGGQIIFTSELGNGTTFTVKLPLNRGKEANEKDFNN